MDNSRIILELLNRVAVLEDEVAALKAWRTNEDMNTKIKGANDEDDYEDDDTDDKSGRKDTTKYLFESEIYHKNRLVLAVVRKYVQNHPEVSAEQLMKTFDRSLQGSFGVVRKLDEVRKSYNNYQVRFFVEKDERINTSTGVCVVCSQWGIFNINRFIERARQLGFNIEEV